MDMRSLATLAFVLAALAGASAAAATPGTTLTVAYFENGREPETRTVHSLRCAPVRGTHPRRTLACKGLARVGRPGLRPVPAGRLCSEIFGGPQTAVVKGWIDGRRVWVRLRRTNGCEIDRWNRLAFLLPVVWPASG